MEENISLLFADVAENSGSFDQSLHIRMHVIAKMLVVCNNIVEYLIIEISSLLSIERDQYGVVSKR